MEITHKIKLITGKEIELTDQEFEEVKKIFRKNPEPLIPFIYNPHYQIGTDDSITITNANYLMTITPDGTWIEI